MTSGEDTDEPPLQSLEFDSTVHEAVRVYRADQSSKLITVLPETTAREVCDGVNCVT